MDLLAATTIFNRLRQSNERFETETETDYALPVEEKPVGHIHYCSLELSYIEWEGQTIQELSLELYF